MELTADIMGYLTQADMFQMFSFFLLFAVTMAVSYLTSSAFKADKPPPDISEIIDCGKEDLDDQVKDDKVVTVTPLLSSPGKKVLFLYQFHNIPPYTIHPHLIPIHPYLSLSIPIYPYLSHSTTIL